LWQENVAADDEKLDIPQRPKATRVSSILKVTMIIASLLVGVLLGYSINYSTNSGRITNLQNQLSTLQEQISNLQPTQNTTNQDITNLQNQLSTLQEQISNLQPTQNTTNQDITYILGENVSLSQLYEQVKESIVVIRGVIVQYDFYGTPYYSLVQGSGFIYNYTGHTVIITNFHVVNDANNITVTFINGNGYAATVLGSDPYADLAILTTDVLLSEYEPLDIVTSSTLKVGDSVIAVGNPYELAGSMSIGVVSSIGRTIIEETTGGYAIANVIQTTTPLNPGNSGGPLMNYQGQVVGVTTAIVADSQGVGFAIPSNTILREIELLVTEGSYNNHPWLGASGTDMTYEIAETIDTNTTYGWLIAEIVGSGPADEAGMQGGTQQALILGEWITIGGDIIIAINETRITSMDDLSSYLEEFTFPGQTINMTILRNNQPTEITVELGTRPSLSSSLL